MMNGFGGIKVRPVDSLASVVEQPLFRPLYERIRLGKWLPEIKFISVLEPYMIQVRNDLIFAHPMIYERIKKELEQPDFVKQEKK